MWLSIRLISLRAAMRIQADQQRGQALAGLVVQLARDAHALIFLRANDLVQQMGPVALLQP
jgi:hypothetical protein